MGQRRTVSGALAVLPLLWLCTAGALVHVRGVPEVSVADYADGRAPRTLVSLQQHVLALNRSTLAAPHYAALLAAARARRTVDLTYETSDTPTPLLRASPSARATASTGAARDPEDGAVDAHITSVVAEGEDKDAADFSTLNETHRQTRDPRDSGAAQHVRLLVLLVEIEGMKAPTCTPAKARATFWEDAESVAAFWARASRGHVGLARDSRGTAGADVAGPFRLRRSHTGTGAGAGAGTDAAAQCDTGAWRDGALAAARAAGVATWQYQHVALVLPPDAPCTWLGLANVGCGEQCYLWVKQCDAPLVIAHELGHNFGLEHAALRAHETGAYVEYGDPTSVMGNRFLAGGARPDLAAPQLAQLAWLPATQLRTATAADGPATHTLAPLDALPEALDAAAPRPQALVVVNPETQSRFYLAYRSEPRAVAPRRVLVHKWIGTYYPTELVAVLAPGAVYADRLSQLAVRVASVTPTTAVLDVAFDCVRRAPLVRVVATHAGAPSGSDTGPAHDVPLAPSEGGGGATAATVLPRGAPLNYTVLVTNADSGTCLPETLRVRAWADALDVAADADTVQLAPGDTCAVHLAAAWRVNAGVAAIDINVSRVLPRTTPPPPPSNTSSNDNSGEEGEESFTHVHIAVAAPPETCTGAPGTLPHAEACVRGAGAACNSTDTLALRTGETLHAAIALLGTGACGAPDRAQRYRVTAALNRTTCPATAAVHLQLDNKDNNNGDTTVELARGTRVRVPLDIVAAADGVAVSADAGCTLDVAVQALSANGAESASAAAVVLQVPLVLGLACPSAPPLTVTPLPTLAPRQTVWASVRLFGAGAANAAAYDGCAYDVAVPARAGLPVGVQVLATHDRVTVRNGTAALRVLVAAADRVASAELDTTLRIGTAAIALRARIDPTSAPCEPRALVPLVGCSARAVAPGDPAGGTCVLRVANNDPWPCPATTVVVARPSLSANYTLDGFSDEGSTSTTSTSSSEGDDEVARIELGPGEMAMMRFGFTRKEEEGRAPEEETVEVEVRVRDTEGAGVHSATVRTSVGVGACVPRPLEVVLATPAPAAPVFLGQAVSASVAVRSHSSAHCRAATVATVTLANASTAAFAQQPPRTLTLAPGASRTLAIVAYDTRTVAAPEPNATVEPVLITFTAVSEDDSYSYSEEEYDLTTSRESSGSTGESTTTTSSTSSSTSSESHSTSRESSTSESSSESGTSSTSSSSSSSESATSSSTGDSSTVTTTFFVDTRCVLGPVSMEVLPYDGAVALGGTATVALALNVSSADAAGACAGAVARVALAGSVPVGLRGTIEPGALTLAPGAWALANVTLHTRANLAGGAYRATLTATVADRPRAPAASATANVSVACPAAPAAPRDVAASQTTPLFATRTVAALTWRACDTAAACCCPCTYAVYRDGARVGTTATPAFADTQRLARGRTYNYTVQTVDAHGAVSPPACVAVLLVAGEPADRATLAALVGTVVACAVIAAATAVAVVCIVRWDRVRPRLLRVRALLCARRYGTAGDAAGAAGGVDDDGIEIVDLAAVPSDES